jgi:hypothetical protein
LPAASSSKASERVAEMKKELKKADPDEMNFKL